MCGICGFVGYRKEQKDVLKEMMSKLIHRGPDSEGSYQDSDVSVGFRRLAIVDLEKGEQPIFNENKSMLLICNGEIYNYREIRITLEECGHIFSTDSDVEVILHGYEEYGKRILYLLKGMFAFVVWNSDKKELFAARDFFGIKPFYYSNIGSHFVFGSEIKAILAFPDYQKCLNQEALEQYLSFQYSVLPETFFKGIFQLMPGHMLTYKYGAIHIEQYFEAMLIPDKSIEKNLDNTEKKLREELQKSIKRHMNSDVEIGGFLSGGIDSNYLSVMAKCGKLFTVGYEENCKAYSEVEKAETLREQIGFEHYIRYISKDEFWNILQSVLYFMDEPCGDASAVALYFVAEAASRHVKVVLSGEGADELFGGYEIYREDDALKWVKWIPEKCRRRLAESINCLPDVKGRDYLIRAGIPLEERYIGNAHIFTTKERRMLLKKASNTVSTTELLKEKYQKTKGMTAVEKMQTIDIHYWLPGDILHKADRMSMAHSLELRVPYLDMGVFSIARKLSKKAKIRNGKTKYLFRKTIREVLPPKISDRRKKGFPVPIRVWIKEEPWNSSIRKVFKGKTAEKYFYTDHLLEILDAHTKGRRDNSRKIWTVYMFLLWCEVFDMDN